jgi:hypothetical protein
MLRVLTKEEGAAARQEQIRLVVRAIHHVREQFPGTPPEVLTGMLMATGTDFGLLDESDIETVLLRASEDIQRLLSENLGEVRTLHKAAMHLCDTAAEMRANAHDAEAMEQVTQAYLSEAKAARMLVWHPDAELSRSVLFRSAATLAMDCGHYADAQRLVEEGLSSQPPADISLELEILLATLELRVLSQAP